MVGEHHGWHCGACDAGKTTLTEQLLYRAGELRAAGSVDRGTAQTDFCRWSGNAASRCGPRSLRSAGVGYG